jgi:hypothetical protein
LICDIIARSGFIEHFNGEAAQSAEGMLKFLNGNTNGDGGVFVILPVIIGLVPDAGADNISARIAYDLGGAVNGCVCIRDK